MKKRLGLVLGGILLATIVTPYKLIPKSIFKDSDVKNYLTLEVGENFNLKITQKFASLCSDKIIYSSSNPLTANVDEKGNIIAEGGGKTTITARSKVSNKILAQCKVMVKKPPHITISLIADPSLPPVRDNELYKLLEDKLNVNFKINYYVGNLDEKLGIMIASGEYPDIIGSQQKLIDAKAEIPLEELIDKYAPNLKKHYQPYYSQIKDSRSGHIYCMPNYGRIYGEQTINEFEGTGFFIQKAVLKEFGYPKIETLDQYFQIIKKYKDKHPIIDGKPTIGYEIESYDWHNFGLVNPPEFLAGYPNDGNVIVNQRTYKAQIFADKDIMKRFIKKLNDMNAEGLVDPESFLLNHDQYIEKLSTGNVLGFCDQRWNIISALNSLAAQKKYGRQYVGLPLVFDKSIKERYIDAGEINIGNGWAITKSCKNPVRVIKFFNAIMTEDWQKRFQWGEKGKDYLIGKNGTFYRTPAMRKEQSNLSTYNPKYKADAVFGQAPKMEGYYSDGNACSAGGSLEEFYEGLNSYDKKFLAGYGYKCWADFYGPPPLKNPQYYPCWSISLNSKSSAAVAIAKIKDIEMRILPNVIMSAPSEFESSWKAYVKMIKKVDVKAYEKAINEAIQWRIKHWKS